MVASRTPFPDIEAGIIEYLATEIPELVSDDAGRFRYKHVGDELPNDYARRLPFVEVGVRGGASDGVTLMVEAEFVIFAQARQTARQILVQTFARMGVYPRKFGGVVADTVQVAVWPGRAPQYEPDEVTVCFSGELTITLRR